MTEFGKWLLIATALGVVLLSAAFTIHVFS